ncbi:hypothetical protein KIN20_013080 [Parelaphostrongylus tenuis]|uniref:Uncharacterized protein n=1 Tax=Parelaphostrongylus tenuis TaxID=148309 RepID=A0AAD5MF12_PARTN|nr:hypothetical protein KIN20_013080 [Parelaphostrongylus tenuis]
MVEVLAGKTNLEDQVRSGHPGEFDQKAVIEASEEDPTLTIKDDYGYEAINRILKHLDPYNRALSH